MYQRLFQVTIVLFFVVVSIAIVAMIVTALLNSFASPLLARDEGIVMVVGGFELKRLAYMIIAGSLLIAGFYVFVRRRRFRR
jgi:hypothetical protein